MNRFIDCSPPSRPLAEQVRRIGERHGIRNIRVFGSLARGDARPESDVDLLVEYVPGESGFAFVRFCDEVETLLGRRVDVVTDENRLTIVWQIVERELPKIRPPYPGRTPSISRWCWPRAPRARGRTYQLLDGGEEFRWEALAEDLSVASLLGLPDY